MSEGVREVPTSNVAHPLVDEVGTAPDGSRWLITESRAPIIFLTPGRVDLLNRAAAAGRRVVLVTDELSRLTPLLADCWRDAGACWVVKDAQAGLRDGFSGRRLSVLQEVWTAPSGASFDELAINHLRPARPDAIEVTAVVSVRLPARDATVLGEPLTRLTEAIHGAPPQAWGSYEPIGNPWDRTAVTEFLRGRMPRETMVLAASPQMRASISAQRTQHGVEEVTHAHLALVTPTAAQFEATSARLRAALARLAETSMPLVALLMARPGRRDLQLRPVLQSAPAPFALLVGPPAVRSLELQPSLLLERFGAELVGRPRLPGLLFDLGDDGLQAWRTLDEVLSEIGSERLGEAIGLVAPKIAAARAPRANGGADAQP